MVVLHASPQAYEVLYMHCFISPSISIPILQMKTLRCVLKAAGSRLQSWVLPTLEHSFILFFDVSKVLHLPSLASSPTGFENTRLLRLVALSSAWDIHSDL